MRSAILAIVVLLLILAESWASAAPLKWQAADGYRWARLNVNGSGKTGFTLLAPTDTGVWFTNTLGEWEGAANRVLYNGSGLAVGDYDSDGLPDIFLCGLDTPNALYKNVGDWKFREVTREAGLVFSNKFYRGAVFADLNGDRALDLLIATTGQGVLCFLNNGKGHFSDATSYAGTSSRAGSVTLALADVDGNGTLDLYVANNRTDDIRDRGQVDIHQVRGQLTIPPWYRNRLLLINGQLQEYGEADQLLLNDGKGRFAFQIWTNGMFLDEDGKALTAPPLDWGLTAMFRDMNNDGSPDLYVCNDYWTPDRIWINDGKGHFRAIDRLAFRNTSASSMGVDFADLDHDGYYECFVVDMLSRESGLRKRQNLAQTPMPLPVGAIDNRPQIMRNTLFHNCGDGTYAEIANFAGLSASEWSWSPVFLDVDLDGYEDVLITSGHSKDVQDMDAAIQLKGRQPNYTGVTNAAERQRLFTEQKMLNGRLYPRLNTPIVAFHNLGGLRFEEVTAKWGTEQLAIHHGIAMADFDNDGDLDFVVNNLGAIAGVYRNDTAVPRVAVRLKGLGGNTQGIGARVKLLNGAVPMQEQEIISGGRYMSGSDPMITFAAGKAQSSPSPLNGQRAGVRSATESAMTIEVRWRSGKSSVVRDVQANRIYEVDESVSSNSRTSPKSAPAPLFRDISERLAHSHHEEAFDDFQVQPLLPKKLSQLGPGIAWFDVDRDGWDDLIIGSGRGGALSVFRNDQKGSLTPMRDPPIESPITRDQATVLGVYQPGGNVSLLVGSMNYEDGVEFGPLLRQYDLSRKTLIDTFPGQLSTTGPMALGDLDGDGDLDLFVGGRCVAGRYPEPAASMLFRYDQGRWNIDSTHARLLAAVGLVSGAVWSDLDGDGFPELVLACEWGPVHVFKNQKGQLQEVTTQLGLDKFTGWWAGVTAGDLDGDGLPDLIVSNWGLNSPYQASADKPLRIFYGDVSERGIVDLVETEYDTSSGQLVPSRNLYAMASIVPSLPERFQTHKAYSTAPLDAVLGDRKSRTRELQAATLASMVFLNRSNRFEPLELPGDAQWAPAFALNIADFDGDGFEDVFLSQNFFATTPELPRLDAGRGLLLRGKGNGKFEPVSATESGLRIYGEQRGAAAGDFNGDGRVDLAVTQNGAATKLFENTRAKPGLRLRLNAGPANPTGVGSLVRLKFGEKFGPAREIHAGSGYWSQDSSVPVLGGPQEPTAVWVRWPGGKTTTTPVPPKSHDLTITADSPHTAK